MKTLNIALVLAGLTPLGALPAAAQSAPAAVPSDASKASDPSAGRDTYLQSARATLQTWRQQLDAFDTKVQTEGSADGRAAADQLNLAWARTKDGVDKLQTAGAEGWERAKASFEDTSRDFTEGFDKVRPSQNTPSPNTPPKQ